MVKPVNLSPPPSRTNSGLPDPVVRWLYNMYSRVGNGPFTLQGYTSTSLPPATDFGSTTDGEDFGSLIFIRDEGALAFSDGNSWVRLTASTGSGTVAADSDKLDGQHGSHYLNRANHTGTQLSSTIADFGEAVDDRVSSLVTDTLSVLWTYNDATDTLSASVSLSGFDTGDLAEGTNLYWTQARFDQALSQSDTDDVSEGTTNLYYTQARFDADFAAKDTGDLTEGTNLYYTDERVDDRVNSLLQAGTNVTLTYDDVNGTLTIDASVSGGTVTQDDLLAYSLIM